MRLVTYNIHKGIGGVDRAYRPERIRDVISPWHPDLVLLQEVDEGARRSQGHRQVDLLGDFLGLRHRVFAPNVRVPGGGHYGNAILSRFPITDWENIDLSLPMTRRRSVLHARLRAGRPARTLHVFNLHLGLSQIIRKVQLRKFLSAPRFLALDPRAPAVLAGDFNDVWGTLGERFLVPVGFSGMARPLRTFPAIAPVRALDSIYVRGHLKLEDVRRPTEGPARWASDHLPLFGEIRFR